MDKSCKCSRLGRHLPEKSVPQKVLDSLTEENPPIGEFVGKSSCNDYVTSLGSSQKVVSYSYFGGYRTRYTQLLANLSNTIKTKYPSWRMRIYHDVTFEKSPRVMNLFCKTYCNFSHVDFCYVPPSHDPETRAKHFGLLYRFRPIGDPTVRYFLSRDLDSYILDREVGPVNQWLESKLPFHVMRDHPWHGGSMLGGLWGFKNYANKGI